MVGFWRSQQGTLPRRHTVHRLFGPLCLPEPKYPNFSNTMTSPFDAQINFDQISTKAQLLPTWMVFSTQNLELLLLVSPFHRCRTGCVEPDDMAAVSIANPLRTALTELRTEMTMSKYPQSSKRENHFIVLEEMSAGS